MSNPIPPGSPEKYESLTEAWEDTRVNFIKFLFNLSVVPFFIEHSVAELKILNRLSKIYKDKLETEINVFIDLLIASTSLPDFRYKIDNSTIRQYIYKLKTIRELQQEQDNDG